MGGLCQTALCWPTTSAGVSRALYAPRRAEQPTADLGRCPERHLRLQRLRRRVKAKDHDAGLGRVCAPLLPARVAGAFCEDPALRFARQSPAPGTPGPCPQTFGNLCPDGSGAGAAWPGTGPSDAAGIVCLLPTADVGPGAGSGAAACGAAGGYPGLIMKNVLHPQNVLRENAPPTAWRHGAAAQTPGRVPAPVCLAWNGWLVAHLRREQAPLFTADRCGRCCDATLELARIYFPQ